MAMPANNVLGLRALRLTHRVPELPAASSRWITVNLLHQQLFTESYRVRPVDCSPDDDCYFSLKKARADLINDEHRHLAQGVLQREAQVSRSVSHRHLAVTLGVEQTPRGVELLQPLCSGDSLLTFALSCSLATKLWLIRQAAEALMAMHLAGWIHGCFEGNAVGVDSAGHATVGELGWSRKIDSPECRIADHPFIGSITHAAPETFDIAGQITAAADVYSLGTTLFQLLAQRTPFADYAEPELVAVKRLRLPPDVREFTPALPFGVASLIQRMLAREPLRRPLMSEVIQALIAQEIGCFAQSSAAA